MRRAICSIRCPGPYGAHGRFDARARSHSWETFISRHRNVVWAAIGVAAGGRTASVCEAVERVNRLLPSVDAEHEEPAYGDRSNKVVPARRRRCSPNLSAKRPMVVQPGSIRWRTACCAWASAIFGGRMVRIEAPDRNGQRADVLLGFDNVRTYATAGGAFGALLGRNANRIAGAQARHRWAGVPAFEERGRQHAAWRCGGVR